MRTRAIAKGLPVTVGTWQRTGTAGDGGGSGAGRGGASTTSVTVAECVRLPLVPAMVTGNEPVAVAPDVVTESVDEEVAGFGSNDAVTPLGSPL